MHDCFGKLETVSRLTKCQNERKLSKEYQQENISSFKCQSKDIDHVPNRCSSHYIGKPQQRIKYSHASPLANTFYALLVAIAIGLSATTSRECISVKPIDFQRHILPCYTGHRMPITSTYNQQVVDQAQSINNPASNNSPIPPQPPPVSYSGGPISGSSRIASNNNPQQGQYGQQSNQQYASTQQQRASSGYTSELGSLSNFYDPSGGGLLLGQRLPHGQTIENFIELVAKIESNHPRLANNLDQFIRVILNRFHYDNYYWDRKSNEMSSSNDKDIRSDINELLLNPPTVQQQQHIVSDIFSEQALTDDEKCSMYFMLSHHIEKEYLPLGSTIKGPQRPLSDNQQYGLLPVVRNNPGNPSNPYPALQASAAQLGTASRYPGPAPGFGSAAANGPTYSAINQPSYNGNNPFGMNSQFPSSNPIQYSSNYARPNTGGSAQGGMIYPPVNSQNTQQQQLLQAQQNSNRQKIAYEFGVVSVGNQDDSGVVLSRVLLGILAASQPSQQIRQLAASVYPNFDLSGTAKRVDEDIDPLFAVTLSDLWAISADHRKPLSQIILGNEGHWNNTMCPTSFRLDRSESIKFTTAELSGGLDGFNLGRAVRGIMEMRRSIKLSDLLRMYYSRSGFRPQFPDIGVCHRGSAFNSRQEELKAQAENYLRLYDLKSPETDAAVLLAIARMDSFRDMVRRSAIANLPRSICDEPTMADMAMGNNNECEVSKADVVSIVDVSLQANEPFMEQCIVKVSQKINMWKYGSTMSVMTNQMDSLGYSNSYSFNEIVKNSSNPTLIGCALMYDRSRTFQGGQISEPVRLVEMFEQTLVSMSEGRSIVLTSSQQQAMSSSYGGNQPVSVYSNYVPASSMTSRSNKQYGAQMSNGLKNTGSSKSIIWFNYGSMARPQATTSSFNNPYSSQEGSSSYRFKEAKRILGENFPGVAILAVGTSNEDLSPFVFDQKDVFSQAPAPVNMESYTDSLMSGQSEGVSGPADMIADQLVKRICESPASFEYPNCYRTMSDRTVSTGYITPGKKQYWMMNPRTFFSSNSIKMTFKVEGGRLRVCFGREPRPDETAQSAGVQFGSSGMSSSVSQTTSSTSNYNLGRAYGVCKEVSQGQEIDFVVDDPCYKESIVACKPFYFVVKELGQAGDYDPNWICRDEGCKRLDQVKFTLLHTGITCSSALVAGPQPILICGSIICALWLYYYKDMYFW